MKVFLIVFIAAVIVSLLFFNRPQQQEQLQELAPMRVAIGKVKVETIYPTTRITGKLQAARKARLAFEVAGKIKHRHIEPGQSVLAGTTLLSIEDTDFIDTLAQRQASLAREQNAIARDRQLVALLGEQRALQQKEVARLKKLKQQSLASASHYDAVLARLLQLQAEEARLNNDVDSAAARHMLEQLELKKAQRNLQRTRLTAPFDGVVNAVSVEPGDYVVPGTIAVELLQVAALDLHLEVPNHLASYLQIGQEITVHSDDMELTGAVVSFSIDPDPETNTHALEVRLAGTHLHPGKLVEAVLPGGYFQDAYTVPVTAILHKENKAFLYKIEDKKLTQVAITLIKRVGDIYIINGIDPSADIVIRGVTTLVAGQTVTPFSATLH